jgi:hypothetical protein
VVGSPAFASAKTETADVKLTVIAKKQANVPVNFCIELTDILANLPFRVALLSQVQPTGSSVYNLFAVYFLRQESDSLTSRVRIFKLFNS